MGGYILKNKKIKKKRVDISLVDKGLAQDLQEARALVMAGKVVANDQRVEKPAELIPLDCVLRIKGKKSKFVSRGGEKLAFALKHLQLTNLINDAVVLDIGASTGGFTDCCLQLGAKQVYALDVGTNQLAWSLRSDPRVISIEKTDIRSFDCNEYRGVNVVVADISFNSLARLVPDIVKAAEGSNEDNRQAVHYLLLVKPQFELPKEYVPSGGVVVDEESRELAFNMVKDVFLQHGFKNENCQRLDCGVEGRTGNREIFIYVHA